AAASTSPAPGTPRSGIAQSACCRFGEAGGSSRTAQTSSAGRSADAVLTRRLPMSELEPEHDPNQADEEYLADAYAALDDDQRQQGAESATAISAADTSAAADTETEEQTSQPTNSTTAPTEPGQQPVEKIGRA